jgi:hypothetical protein
MVPGMSASPSAPERVVLHVGLHKTGTTYLQSLLRQNRQRLARRHGIYVPPGLRTTVFASLDLITRHSGMARDPRTSGAWDRLAADVNGCGLPTALVSQERLSVARPRHARRAVQSFPESQVDVVVTVRDLPRLLVSYWQEAIKNGVTWTLDEYVTALRDPDSAGVDPARRFWLHEDVTGVLRCWGSAVPADRLHVVTVPPAGSAPELLTDRFASVLGLTHHDLPREPRLKNENIGLVGTELLRRLNERLDGRLPDVAYDFGVKRPVVQGFASLPRDRSSVLDDEQRAWAASVSARFAEEIGKNGYRVVGDLTDLQPDTSSSTPSPTAPTREVTDAELLDAALAALTELSIRHGKVMAERDLETAPETTDLAGWWARVGTHAKSRTFAAQRAAADLAVRTRLGRRAAASYMRRRAGR